MQYPKLAEEKEKREFLRVFRGLNRALSIGEGEFHEMRNLTSMHYPVLSTRPERGRFPTAGKVNGLLDKDGLCYTEDGDFVIGGYHVPMRLTTGGKKTLVSMGAYVIVMPDKKYVNTARLDDFGEIEASVTTRDAVSFSLCTANGEAMDDVTVSATAPESPENASLWMDVSVSPHVLKRFSAESGIWTEVVSTYVRISSAGIGLPFEVNDGVRISGIVLPALVDLNAFAVVRGRGDDYLIVAGLTDEFAVQTESVTVERRMPDTDFLIESGNRLWGCRYGTDKDGRIVNEIYASKLGDFKNWECYEGISTDSYAASVGTDGAFTGAVTYLGYPLFFKEGYVHKVYGSLPSSFQIQTTACRGVQKGCAESIAILNEILYYRSRNGICAYDGSLPVDISAALGPTVCERASAGVLGPRYYISLMGEESALFVYDTVRGLWHREDDMRAVCFCTSLGELYLLDEDGVIHTVSGSGLRDGEPIVWCAETGLIGTDDPDRKRISRLELRMALGIGSRMRVAIQYDSLDEWQTLFTMSGGRLRSFTVPIRPRACDHLRLRFEGEGEAKLYSISKTIVTGGG